MHKKNYIIVKDRHPRISEVLNDCISLCVSASKDEPLSCILQKICDKLTSVTSRTTALEDVTETIQSSLEDLQEQVDSQNILQVAEITLTDAQIKALPTTPVQLVAAPGAGKIIVPMFYLINGNTEAGAYTNIDTIESNIIIQSPSQWWYFEVCKNLLASGYTYITALLGGTAKMTIRNPFINGSIQAGGAGVIHDPFQTDDLINEGLEIAVPDNDGGNYTGGNAANTLKVTVYYVVVDL